MPLKPNPLTRGKKRRALALLQHHQLAAAIPLLEQVCESDRSDVETWYLLAATHQELGNFSHAADSYRQAILLQPDRAETHYYLGNTCLALGQTSAAATAFEQAIQLRPDYLEAYLRLGALCELQRDFTAAETVLRKALQLKPGNVDLHFRLGNALAQLDHPDEAIRCYREALRLQPNFAAVYINLGNTLARLRRFDEAIANYLHALEIQPDEAAAQTNLGNVQRYQGKLAESLASHRDAIKHNPDYADTHFNLAFSLLVTGQFQEGWREYEWRWRREGGMRRPMTPTPWRQGIDIQLRHVFLHAEQGIGDELFFLRFVPRLKQKGAGSVTYRPSGKTASLLRYASVIDRLADPIEVPAPDDIILSVGDLPGFLEMRSVDQIPPSLALSPRVDLVDEIRRKLTAAGPPPYLGVTWRAGDAGNDLVLHKESPPERLAKELRGFPGTFLILQRHPKPGEVAAFQQALGRPVHDLSILNEDLEQMLALLSLIDEYVGVSNTNMHLRAAAGKTARVLVSSPPEWRWMAEGKESPWFPGFRVYRQGYDGDWRSALKALQYDLC